MVCILRRTRRTAKAYRDSLAPPKISDERGRSLDSGGLLYEELAHAARKAEPDLLYHKIDDAAERVSQVVRAGTDLNYYRQMIATDRGLSAPEKSAVNAAIDRAKQFNITKQGKTYEVDINANPEHFLDWDKPLSEQHPKVQAARHEQRPKRHLTGQTCISARHWDLAVLMKQCRKLCATQAFPASSI